ncbi:MAG: hypothetical protein GX270_06255 [Clostridiaceae bacterium]|jgi:hypothetical protein|nr:hypothetical protein [Clostridiaceae bacterium]
MSITVSLFSRKIGEIRGFLEKYYQRQIKLDNDVGQWTYIYNRPLEAIDMISTVIDNSHRHKINLSIQVDQGDIHLVTSENYNDIIKALLHVYYKDDKY